MILFALIFAIVTTWLIVFFDQHKKNKKNKDRYKNIYSNENYYD